MPSLASTSAELIRRIVSSVTRAFFAVSAWINWRAGLLLLIFSSLISVLTFGDRDFLRWSTFSTYSSFLWRFLLEVDRTISWDCSRFAGAARLLGETAVNSFSTRRFAPKFFCRWPLINSSRCFYSSAVSGATPSDERCWLVLGWNTVYLILCLMNFLVYAIALYFRSDSSPLSSIISWLDFLMYFF